MLCQTQEEAFARLESLWEKERGDSTQPLLSLRARAAWKREVEVERLPNLIAASVELLL